MTLQSSTLQTSREERKRSEEAEERKQSLEARQHLEDCVGDMLVTVINEIALLQSFDLLCSPQPAFAVRHRTPPCPPLVPPAQKGGVPVSVGVVDLCGTMPLHPPSQESPTFTCPLACDCAEMKCGGRLSAATFTSDSRSQVS